MDNMENSSYHNDIIKGFDFNREDFKSPAKRNLMIGAEEADYSGSVVKTKNLIIL